MIIVLKVTGPRSVIPSRNTFNRNLHDARGVTKRAVEKSKFKRQHLSFSYCTDKQSTLSNEEDAEATVD